MSLPNELIENKLCINTRSPTKTDNAPITGYIWIETKQPTIYVCLDNTEGNNVWKHIDEDRIKALEAKYNQYLSNLAYYQSKLNEYNNYVRNGYC